MNYPSSFIDYCIHLGLRFTSLRKNVLYLLWRQGKPLKAYEILEQLKGVQLNAKPTTIYRVLDYFVSCKLVHKIDSIQSYMLCHSPEQHFPMEVLMVCNHCHRAQESYEAELHDLIIRLAKKNHFHSDTNVIEVKGICEQCTRCP